MTIEKVKTNLKFPEKKGKFLSIEKVLIYTSAPCICNSLSSFSLSLTLTFFSRASLPVPGFSQPIPLAFNRLSVFILSFNSGHFRIFQEEFLHIFFKEIFSVSAVEIIWIMMFYRKFSTIWLIIRVEEPVGCGNLQGSKQGSDCI